jgi:hypothetical protein
MRKPDLLILIVATAALLLVYLNEGVVLKRGTNTSPYGAMLPENEIQDSDAGKEVFGPTAAGEMSVHGSRTILQPPPEGSASARRRNRQNYNSIQIAIAYYVPGSSADLPGLDTNAEADETGEVNFFTGTFSNDPEYVIDHSNRVFGWVKEATRILSPDSWHLLMQYESLPSVSRTLLGCGKIMEMNKPAETFHYLSGNNVYDVIGRMSSNIHEISHGYSRMNIFRYIRENSLTLEMSEEGRLIYLSPDESYLVTFPRNYLFPAARLSQSIPESRQTLRFKTYIAGSTSTQVHGILALLDELNAYYLGSRFRYEMLDAYKIAGPSEAEGFFEWVSGAHGTMGAFFEMEYFILEYLLYMKENHPEQYEMLKSHRAFRDAWRAVRTSYSRLVYNYFMTLHKEKDSVNDSGEYELSVEDNRLWITRSGERTSTSRPVISSAMNTLMPVLDSDRFWEIEQDFAVGLREDKIYSGLPDALNPSI